MNLSPNENRQWITRYLAALSGQPKTPALVERFVRDAALAEHIRQVEAAFPAYELLADDLIAEGDLVAMRGVFRGVHRGAFAGIEATGKSVSAGLMIMYRINGGRIVEHWMQFDLPALIGQLKDPAAAMTTA
jgi:predicted ester cyclase